jgi:hypothetical protein
MFTVDCPRHQTRVLLGSRAIDAMVNTEHGVEIHWHCHCGATGTLAPVAPAAPIRQAA